MIHLKQAFVRFRVSCVPVFHAFPQSFVGFEITVDHPHTHVVRTSHLVQGRRAFAGLDRADYRVIVARFESGA